MVKKKVAANELRLEDMGLIEVGLQELSDENTKSSMVANQELEKRKALSRYISLQDSVRCLTCLDDFNRMADDVRVDRILAGLEDEARAFTGQQEKRLKKADYDRMMGVGPTQ